MEFLDEIISVLNTILPLSFWDVLDIAVLSVLIYKGCQLLLETRAVGLVKGILAIVAAYVIAKVFQMKTLIFVLDHAFSMGVLAIIILFQPEIRRTLERVGHMEFLERQTGNQEVLAKRNSHAINVICDACRKLSDERTGALIVIERRTKLGEHINGTVLCAVPSEKFFDTIFYNGTPLHDGAVIMRGGLIYAAACFLPTASKEETVDKALGARHRAAIGMSENSDAVIIVVSEETGKISVAENGLLKEDFSIFDLRPYLTSKQPTFSSFSESIRSGEFSAADAVCDACENFSDNSTGAIIIIERSNVLDQFLTDVTIIDALPTKEALGTIFYKGTAMSSQAVVIRDNLIHSAATINVPLPETLENKTLGARHKAAIGLSRCSDALVIVVSEETGTISVADNVKGDDFTRRGFDRNELRQYLTDKMNPKKPDTPPAQEKKAGEESPIAIIKRHMSKKAETSSDKEK